MKFGQSPCTIVQGLWPDFGATLKIFLKSNFDWNQLKLSMQHKYMYYMMHIHAFKNALSSRKTTLPLKDHIQYILLMFITFIVSLTLKGSG